MEGRNFTIFAHYPKRTVFRAISSTPIAGLDGWLTIDPEYSSALCVQGGLDRYRVVVLGFCDAAG